MSANSAHPKLSNKGRDPFSGPAGDAAHRTGAVDVSELRGLLHEPGRRPVSVEQMNKVIRKAARLRK